MTGSNDQGNEPKALRLLFTDDALTAHLADGRSVTVPFSWYPRLVHATTEERLNYRVLNDGEGIHWPDLDENLSVRGFLEGWPSTEKEWSLRQWLDARKEGRPLALDKLREYEKQQQKAKA